MSAQANDTISTGSKILTVEDLKSMPEDEAFEKLRQIVESRPKTHENDEILEILPKYELLKQHYRKKADKLSLKAQRFLLTKIHCCDKAEFEAFFFLLFGNLTYNFDSSKKFFYRYTKALLSTWRKTDPKTCKNIPRMPRYIRSSGDITKGSTYYTENDKNRVFGNLAKVGLINILQENNQFKIEVNIPEEWNIQELREFLYDYLYVHKSTCYVPPFFGELHDLNKIKVEGEFQSPGKECTITEYLKSQMRINRSP